MSTALIPSLQSVPQSMFHSIMGSISLSNRASVEVGPIQLFGDNLEARRLMPNLVIFEDDGVHSICDRSGVRFRGPS